MVRVTCGALALFALPLCLLFAGCRSAGLVTAAPAPRYPATAIPASVEARESPGRLRRSLVPMASRSDDLTPSANPNDNLMERFASQSDGGTSIGGGFAVPSSRSSGIGGTPLRASIEFLAPDIVNVGLFYQINDRWTVGILGQRLAQERTVSVEGQLIDPNDLSSFINGFTVREQTTSIAFGPFVQYRIFEERGLWPEISVAGYALEWGTVTSASTDYSMPAIIINKEASAVSEGDNADKYRTLFLSASKPLPFFEGSSFLQGMRAYGGAGVGVRTGKRYTTAATGAGDPRVRLDRKDLTRYSFVGWLGAEAQLPLDLSGFGEVFTGDECAFGYAAGVRWTSPFGVTFALGVSNCVESIPQRALDLLYLPGGVGGQPSLVNTGGGVDAGGINIRKEKERRRRSRRGI